MVATSSALRALCVGLLIGICGSAHPARAEGDSIILASTTSTENSGLLDLLVPLFEAETGIGVKVVAVGTGQAIRAARRGDADVLLVHDQASEEAFVAEGYGVERFDVMYNEFVLIGPRSDPAGIRGGRDAAAALRRIAEREAPFVSRGDDSGTHKAELRIWNAAGIDPSGASGTWYRETGAGQGATLNTASGMNAYVISDRGTWLAFRNRGDLEVLVEGDSRLHNPYGIILVDPRRHPHVRAKEGQAFIDWILSPTGQKAIGSLTREGQQLFIPNAKVATPDPRSPAGASPGSP